MRKNCFPNYGFTLSQLPFNDGHRSVCFRGSAFYGQSLSAASPEREGHLFPFYFIIF